MFDVRIHSCVMEPVLYLNLSCEGEDEELSAVPLEVEDGERRTVGALELEVVC